MLQMNRVKGIQNTQKINRDNIGSITNPQKPFQIWMKLVDPSRTRCSKNT